MKNDPSVKAVVSGLQYWFCGLGYTVGKIDERIAIICPHMCGGYDDDSRDEQRAKVTDMVEDAVKRSQIENVTIRVKDVSTKENQHLHHFLVEILL